MKTVKCQQRDWLNSPVYLGGRLKNFFSAANYVSLLSLFEAEALSCNPRHFFSCEKLLYPSLAAVTFPLITFFSSAQGALLILQCH